jgi:hypothetical protein
MSRWLALLIVLILVPDALGLPDEAVGRVVSVISGDSLGIEMFLADSRTNAIDSIKLADIEVPSTVTPAGKDAQKYAFSLLKNQTVYLDIEDNAKRARNDWSQLICVVYLMDSDFRPVWPPVNRIMVDVGHAVIKDDPNNEFNSSDWWQGPPNYLSSETRQQFLDMLKEASSSEQAVTSPSSGTVGGITPIDSTKVSVLGRDHKSGVTSIGYRK